MLAAFQATNPTYRDSFAQWAFRRNLWNLWHVKGLVDEEWSSTGGIRDQIQEILEAEGDRLRPLRSLKSAKSPSYVLSCYMVGRDEQHATPAAAIVCNDDHMLKESKHIVTQHGVLRRRGWRFLRFRADILRPMDLQGDISEVSDGDELPGQTRSTSLVVSLDKSTSTSSLSIPENSMRIPRSPIGVPIAVYENDRDHGPIATHGGVVEVDGVLVGLTASHIFNTYAPCEVETNLQVELFEEDLQEDITIDSSSQAEDEQACGIESTVHEDMEANEAMSVYPKHSNIAPEAYINQPVVGWSLSPSNSSRGKILGDLDYALISLTWRTFWRSNSFIFKGRNEPERIITPTKEAFKMPKSGKTVLLCTGSRGVIVGTSIESSACLVFSDSTTIKEVWKTSFETIEKGDCGSWAIDPETSELLGMLVGNCPALGEAYIVPAKSVFADIKQQWNADLITIPQEALHQYIVKMSAGSDQILGSPVPLEFNADERVVIEAAHPLWRAVFSGDTTTTKHLIECGADLDMEVWMIDWPLAFIATRDAIVAALNRLIEAGADINAGGADHRMKPLYAAITQGHVELVRILVGKGVDLDGIARIRGTSLSAEEVEQQHPNDEIRNILMQKRKEEEREDDEGKEEGGNLTTEDHDSQ